MLWQELVHILLITKGCSCTVAFFLIYGSFLLPINMDLLVQTTQERALIIIHNDYDSSFSELLEMSNEFTILIKNIKFLMAEIRKFLNDVAPPIMNDFFQKQGNYYSVRNPASLVSQRKFTSAHDINTIFFRGSQIWQNLPQDISDSDSLNLFFKYNIKRYGTLTCHCKLCKSFIPCMGYTD